VTRAAARAASAAGLVAALAAGVAGVSATASPPRSVNIALAVPPAGDLSVAVLTVARRPVLSAPALPAGLSLYAGVRGDGGRWTLRLVLARPAGGPARVPAAAPSVGIGPATVLGALRRTRVLGGPPPPPPAPAAAPASGSIPAGDAPTAFCEGERRVTRRLAGPGVRGVTAGGVGVDACLLLARARAADVPLLAALGARGAARLLAPYPPVSVQVLPPAAGSVTGAGVSCPPRCRVWVRRGTRVELSAAPAAGYSFAGWKGACQGTTAGGGCVATAKGATSIWVCFAPAPAGSPGTPARPAAPGGAAPPTPPPPAAGPLPTRTGVQLFEYAIVIGHATLAAGPVELVATDIGQDPHALAIRDASGHVLASTAALSPQGESTLDLTLAPGTYTLFCPIPGHEAMGMAATLTVR
jgi:hypothetical protein